MLYRNMHDLGHFRFIRDNGDGTVQFVKKDEFVRVSTILESSREFRYPWGQMRSLNIYA